MKMKLIKLLILLLTQQYLLGEDNYPKKLIIQNSLNSKDTIIAQTNNQVEQANIQHVALKACIQYSNLQDSITSDNNKIIKGLQSLNYSILKQDSLSKKTIFLQKQLLVQKRIRSKRYNCKISKV